MLQAPQLPGGGAQLQPSLCGADRSGASGAPAGNRRGSSGFVNAVYACTPGSASRSSPSNRSKSRSKLTSRQPFGSADAILPPDCMQKASSSAGAVIGQNNSFRDGCGQGRPAPPCHSKLWRGSQPSSLMIRVAVGSPSGGCLGWPPAAGHPNGLPRSASRARSDHRPRAGSASPKTVRERAERLIGADGVEGAIHQDASGGIGMDGGTGVAIKTRLSTAVLRRPLAWSGWATWDGRSFSGSGCGAALVAAGV